MVEIQSLVNLLSQKVSVVIVTHINPDGDAIGSSMGLYHFLKTRISDIKVITPNDYPAFLKWMDPDNHILPYDKNKEKAIEIVEKADVIFCLDFNDFVRLKEFGKYLNKAKAKRVLIDHHPEPKARVDYSFSDTSASSTAELVYKFIAKHYPGEIVSSLSASCIYSGILTDTGCFSYSSSNPETYIICSELLKCGINKDSIYNSIYNNYSEKRMRLMGYCLNEKMVVLPDNCAAYITLTKEDQENYSFEMGDSEGFVNLPFSIKNILFTALFIEKKDYVKISFRSRGSFSVNDFSAKHFNGGGHRNAAGGESNISLDDTIKRFNDLLPLYKEELNMLLDK